MQHYSLAICARLKIGDDLHITRYEAAYVFCPMPTYDYDYNHISVFVKKYRVGKGRGVGRVSWERAHRQQAEKTSSICTQ